MDKASRISLLKKRFDKLAKKLGWKSCFNDLPKKTRISIQGKSDIRPTPKKPKKQFGKSSRKDHYGHFSGSCQTHGTRKQIKRRIEDRETKEAIYGP
jgi:hypothetical protein